MGCVDRQTRGLWNSRRRDLRKMRRTRVGPLPYDVAKSATAAERQSVCVDTEQQRRLGLVDRKRRKPGRWGRNSCCATSRRSHDRLRTRTHGCLSSRIVLAFPKASACFDPALVPDDHQARRSTNFRTKSIATGYKGATVRKHTNRSQNDVHLSRAHQSHRSPYPQEPSGEAHRTLPLSFQRNNQNTSSGAGGPYTDTGDRS